MPIYIYECKVCGLEFKVSHGMTETHDKCDVCDSSELVRIPASFVNLSKKREVKHKVGNLTKEYITNAQEDLDRQKEGLEKQR